VNRVSFVIGHNRQRSTMGPGDLGSDVETEAKPLSAVHPRRLNGMKIPEIRSGAKSARRNWQPRARTSPSVSPVPTADRSILAAMHDGIGQQVGEQLAEPTADRRRGSLPIANRSCRSGGPGKAARTRRRYR
jgi:hypothetical protein